MPMRRLLHNQPEITVAFLDVGQGDANVIILPDKRTGIVIDCYQEKTVKDYLDNKGVVILRYVFLSHTDQDHLRGIGTILENYAQADTMFFFNLDVIRTISSSSIRGRLLCQVKGLIEQGRLNIDNPRAGDKWNIQHLQIDCLYPNSNELTCALALDSPNNASVILKITFEGKQALFTGDMEAEGWAWLTQRGVDLKAHILKFPHHGAWYEAKAEQIPMAEVVRKIAPEFVVISVGTDNTYNHPRIETLQLLSTFPNLRFVCTEATKLCRSQLAGEKHCPCAGTVEVTISKKGIAITPDVPTHSKIIEQYETPQCVDRIQKTRHTQTR